MKVFYSDHFVLPLPEGHRFPMSKYSLLRERVAADGICGPGELRSPRAVTDEEILRAHAPDYLERVASGELTSKEIRRIGFPWSERMVERSRRASGGTVGACLAALEEGFAANLAGGTHHAFTDRGEGYCVFNDSAIASRAVQAAGLVERVVVIDTDVHQGNGTAEILRGDETVFTFSIHGAKNFPFHKEESDLDAPLPDGADDTEFLTTLEMGLEAALEAADADLAIYLAGADPFEGDRLGRLSVTKAGLAERDRMVLGACRDRGIPVAVTMAGGYSRNVEDTVDVHFQSIRRAADLLERSVGTDGRTRRS
ncbi:MAG TPA: histone deacetylase [Rubrobacter sp.]|jgi:acetoin utilization deacetylase AcuC-like enzyme|nr:histone deacetylase [Rubrobacter sp.]